jgi:hypothetical protein
VENCRPLQPCSQHWGFGLEFKIRGMTPLLWFPGTAPPLGGAMPGEVSYEGYGAGEVETG